jgi:ABC-type molybdate transport system substrate-binding protein
VVQASRQTSLAAAFIQHLRSAPAQAVFKAAGFGPP